MVFTQMQPPANSRAQRVLRMLSPSFFPVSRIGGDFDTTTNRPLYKRPVCCFG
ncbi:hypothetical protein CLOSTMETH_01417 [[Clostridium] methylpentosum DSM 5476]|uniref:Uncharacterized protein n=1 Tax=[Clostridium] methylpentosum DSM 5476 TaxID=537013 RepID=C0EC48_9FIRM|nr:hypothetical protein CLOSTMETH_01417 [[Clostridium] methylpentosum DSM 5476]